MNAPDKDQRLWNEALELHLARSERPNDREFQRSIAAWCEQSAEHRATWNEVQQVWTVGGQAIGRQPAPSYFSRRKMLGGLGLATAAGIAIVAGPEIYRRSRADFVTRTGEIRRADLPDGSAVTLGPDTEVRVDFSAGRREVELLAGMAYFDVRANSARPFVTSCGSISVAALTSAFEVSNDADCLTVAVDMGMATTQFSSTRTNLATLEAGDWVCLRSDGKPLSSGKRDRQHRAAWRRGLIVAERELVPAVVAKIARWKQGSVVVTPGFSSRRVSGIFDTSDTQSALEAIVAPFDGRVRQVNSWLTFVTPI